MISTTCIKSVCELNTIWEDVECTPYNHAPVYSATSSHVRSSGQIRPFYKILKFSGFKKKFSPNFAKAKFIFAMGSRIYVKWDKSVMSGIAPGKRYSEEKKKNFWKSAFWEKKFGIMPLPHPPEQQHGDRGRQLPENLAVCAGSVHETRLQAHTHGTGQVAYPIFQLQSISFHHSSSKRKDRCKKPRLWVWVNSPSSKLHRASTDAGVLALFCTFVRVFSITAKKIEIYLLYPITITPFSLQRNVKTVHFPLFTSIRGMTRTGGAKVPLVSKWYVMPPKVKRKNDIKIFLK